MTAATGSSTATRYRLPRRSKPLLPCITLSLCCVSSFQVFITNGWMSDLVVVVTVTNREAKTAAHGISLFLVEEGMKGFQKGRKLEKIGLKAQVLECLSESFSVTTWRHPPTLSVQGHC